MRYWTGFNRAHPIEGPARETAWSGTAHGLFAELSTGAVTHSMLQMGLGLSGAFAGIGLTAILAGLGLVWAAAGERRVLAVPDTLPAGTPLPV